MLGLSAEQTEANLFQCCSCRSWVDCVMTCYPFCSAEQLLEVARTAWQELSEADYLEAFKGHPRIGDPGSLQAKYAATRHLASSEQEATLVASEDVLTRLAEGNLAYEKKFGFIFIVFASGKTAKEMLALLKKRLPNDRSTEIANAAAEQEKIMMLRLRNLLPSIHEETKA